MSLRIRFRDWMHYGIVPSEGIESLLRQVDAALAVNNEIADLAYDLKHDVEGMANAIGNRLHEFDKTLGRLVD